MRLPSLRPLFSPLLVLALLHAAPAFTQDSTGMGTLELKAILVASDLSLRPVPKEAFVVRSADGKTFELKTGFDGQAAMELPAGTYALSIVEPISFENKGYSWEVDFTVTGGEIATVELSNDNALIEELAPAPVAPQEVEMNEGALFRRYKGAVCKVDAEGGHGSGFLVDASGLILTNHHVVSQSEYLAVKLDDTTKYLAKLVADDPLQDLAVLWINPSLAEDLLPLPLAEGDAHNPPVTVGERIVAIGSPLATETILTSGIVSKIEEGAIYSDVSINPGNSGGPVLNAQGKAIGISTFGLGASSGPGVSGIVRIHLAAPLLGQAKTAIQKAEPPPTNRLPVESRFRFPPDELQRLALEREIEPKLYHVEAGKFDVQLMTPVLLATLNVDAEKRAAAFREKRSKKKKKGRTEEADKYVPGEGFYEWRQYAGDYRPVVRVQAIPEIRMTGASMFAVAMVGANASKKYRFKADFDRMELLRGTTVVQPIHPGRMTQVVDTHAGLDSMEDIGYYGLYEYPPEAFKPGEPITLKVWKQGDPTPIIQDVKPQTQQRVWTDFEPYFEALEREVEASPK